MTEKQDDLFGDIRDDNILEQLDIDSPESRRFPALLAQLNALLQKELEKLGQDPRISLDLIYAISKSIGGMQLYFPRGAALESLMRDMKIWRDFNGKNVPDLVERYHVTFNTVYAAIRRMRMIEQRKHQPDLFNKE
ncbi:Transcriptional regulator, Middle operon regulator (Mor) family [Pantoea sesami]|nr:Transcriptional regulator, Middle operon regulator (Mor) family [Pantoea sesami]